MKLLPGVLRRPTAAAVTQVFWLLQQKPTALYFIASVGEPKWFCLVPCDHNGKRLTTGEPIRVPSAWLDPDLCMPADLSPAERGQRLLAYLVRQSSAENETHALTVSTCVFVPCLSLLRSLPGRTLNRQRWLC